MMRNPVLRDHWTSAGMVGMKAAVSSALGGWMAFGPDSGFVSPAWRRAFDVLPRQVYGATFAVMGLALLLALWRGQDKIVPYLLIGEGFGYIFFALIFLTYAFQAGGAGVAGALVWAQVAFAHTFVAVRISAR